jgi:hypothetical protein
VALLVAACGGDGPGSGGGPGSPGASAWIADAMDTPAFEEACAATPGCMAARALPVGPSESVWRVRVVRGASGDLRIEEVERIEVPEGDGVPVGPLSGSHALVAVDAGGEVLDGQVLSFPQALRLEYADGSVPGSVDLAGREVDALAYLPASPGVASLAVRDPAGNTLHSVDAPDSAGEQASWGESLKRFVGLEVRELRASAAQAPNRPFQGLPPHCSHIVVLRGEQDRHLARHMQWEGETTLVAPGPAQLAAVQAALARMTPLLCQSIGRIAFGAVTAPETGSILGAVQSAGAGDLVLLNVSALEGRFTELDLERRQSSGLILQGTLIHEAGHAAETLLMVESSAPPESYAGSWGFPPRTLARRTIERARLEKGLLAEWTRIHQSFATQGWAVGSPPSKPDWTPTQAAEAGYMASYGTASIFEDISTTLQHAYMSKTVAEAYRANNVAEDAREDLACIESQRHQERSVPARLAAVYTKLHLLQDLGLVNPEDVRDCLGGSIGLWVDRPGIHVSQDGMALRSFENQLEAGIGDTGQGLKVFQLEARGEAGFGDGTYPAHLRLQLELGRVDLRQASWPRGLYELGMLGNNNFTLRLDGAPAGDFNAMDGFVLVAEASNERIVGSIFMQRSFRPHAPLPVPELHDPPLIFRFLMEK